VGNDSQFAKLCVEIGVPDLIIDPRFLGNPDRVANRDALTARLTAALADRDSATLLARLAALGVPAGPINRVDQVFADHQVVARGLRLSIEAGGATVPGVASPIVIDGARMVSSSPSPRLDESGRDGTWSARRERAADGS
jgi:crotonobetainyl-CoA:carnitine CoA-transferase CaiB-like acyl-CoA transferase